MSVSSITQFCVPTSRLEASPEEDTTEVQSIASLARREEVEPIYWRHAPPVTILGLPFCEQEGEFRVPVLECREIGSWEARIIVYRDRDVLQNQMTTLLNRPRIVLIGCYTIHALCEPEDRLIKVDWKVQLGREVQRDDFFHYAFPALFAVDPNTVVYEGDSSLRFVDHYSLSMEQTVERIKTITHHLMSGQLLITTRSPLSDFRVVSSIEGRDRF